MKKLFVVAALLFAACDPQGETRPPPGCSDTCMEQALPRLLAWQWCSKLDTCSQLDKTVEDCTEQCIPLFVGASCCTRTIVDPCVRSIQNSVCGTIPDSCKFLCDEPQDFGVVPFCEMVGK